MDPFAPYFTSTPIREKVFQFNGKPQTCTYRNQKLLDLILHIDSFRRGHANRFWLLQFRREIRDLIGEEQRNILCHLAANIKDDSLRVLLVWFRGRCKGFVGTYQLANIYYETPDPLLRKETVRALKRMQAWQELIKIFNSEPIDRIRNMAAQRSPRGYDYRLQTFLKREVAAVSMEKKTMPLFVAENVELISLPPLKSSGFIRLILERIHRLVRSTSKHA